VIRLGSGGAHVDEASLRACRQQLGLDNPMIVQFLDFLWNYATFNFGISMWSGNPVVHEIAIRLPVSLEVAVLATVIAILIAIPLGTISALKENTWLDHFVRVMAIAGIATPSFWLGIMSLVLVLDITYLATGKPWLPPIDYVSFWQDPIRNLSMVALPAITVGYRYSAVTMRLTRSAMLEVMREDYIRTARAKGLPPLKVVGVHALRNALIPVVTVIGLQVGVLFTGAILTETIFSWPGVGKWLIEAISRRDYPVLQGGILLLGAIVMAVNLLVDITYGIINPRIRHQR